MTNRILYTGLALFMVAAAASACSEDAGKDSKARKAVEEVVTKDFKLYEGAKDKLKQATQAQEQRRSQERAAP